MRRLPPVLSPWGTSLSWPMRLAGLLLTPPVAESLRRKHEQEEDSHPFRSQSLLTLSTGTCRRQNSTGRQKRRALRLRRLLLTDAEHPSVPSSTVSEAMRFLHHVE